MKRREKLTFSQVLSLLGVVLVVLVSVLAVLGKTSILTFWFTVGVLFLFVQFLLPKLREREISPSQKP